MENYTVNPGSELAEKMGCTCPVLDNCHGQGFQFNGETVFYINEKCPIHALFDSGGVKAEKDA